MRKTCSLLLLILLPCLVSPLASAQLRTLRPIETPAVAPQLPDGAEAVDELVVPSRALVSAAVDQVVENWNANTLENVLSERFYDRERLLQSMDQQVPRDARLRVLAVRDIQALQQYYEADPETGLDRLVTLVSVTVNTQMEYNTSEGFVRLPGTNEFLMQIVEEL